MKRNRTNVFDYDLSKREHIILELITKGYENKEIAGIIHVSAHTVKAHVSAIIRKLEVKNRTHAACKAIRIGLCA